MGAWTPASEPMAAGRGAVTLVEGSSFCICAPGGDLGGAGPHGVFFRDTRILLIRTLLRFDPCLPAGKVWLAPVLPAAFTPLRVEGLDLGPGRITLAVAPDGAVVAGLPPGLEVRTEPRPPRC